MVAKINSGSSIYGALAYNIDKVKAGCANVIYTNKMIQNLSSDKDMDMFWALKSFEPYLLANKRTSKPVAHISINPTLQDYPTDTQLSQIAEDYMNKMGFGDQPYIVFKHSDIKRKHIHIVTVRIDETGKKIKDSYENLRSMDICRELEIKYGLDQIRNKKEGNKQVYLRKIIYEKGDVKRQISNTVKSLIEDYQFQTLGEFNALLSCYNIHSKYVKGEEKGNIYNGVIYSATNESGEMVGNPIKSSRIGRFAGYEALMKRMKTTIDQNKKSPPIYPKQLIAGIMRISSDKDIFIRKMKENNIDVVFRTNEDGRIYGATFIDYNKMMVYNGSRIGKEFSANAFNDQFNKQAKNRNNSFTPRFDESKSSALEKENIQFYAPEPVDEIFGEFYLDYKNYDLEEEQFARKMKKRKKNL